MNILIINSDGFIGKNLYRRLECFDYHKLYNFKINDSLDTLYCLVNDSDFIFYFPDIDLNNNLLLEDNHDANVFLLLCKSIHRSLIENYRSLTFISSSIFIKALHNSDLFRSIAEYKNVTDTKHIFTDFKLHLLHLPDIFGKWSKPNYNSIVMTFCYNVSRNIPLKYYNPNTNLNLLYIDDLIDKFIEFLNNKYFDSSLIIYIQPEFVISFKQLAEKIINLHKNRLLSSIDPVAIGFSRPLYSTYLSYLPETDFGYSLKTNTDKRGDFCEILKTSESGQFSFFTINPGFTRGQHFHHTKTEKFLVVQGSVRFDMYCLNTENSIEIYSSDKKYEIIDSIPGWVHSVTNISNIKAIILLWANEVFDINKPDTISW